MIGVGRAGPVGPEAAAPAPTGRGHDRRSAAQDRPYWIALSLVPGVGPVGFQRIVQRYGSARAAWEAGGAILDYLPRTVPEASFALRRLSKEGPVAAAERVEEATRRAGGVVLTGLDRGYPAMLANLEPHPPVLYVRGDLGALEQTCVAIVGTRRPTGYGRATTAELADELARATVTIVSGLAIGIDGEAHRAAVRAGGRSVAVLPSPVTRIYPPVHRALAAQLVESGGALITEVPPGGPTGRPDFARRNRIIAGLSQAVVVVEAPDRSGALLTAAAALAYERELYAVPGPIDALASRGCNRLIADQQATIVTSVASLLHRVGAASGTHAPVAVASLSESEALVLAVLLERSASIEELMVRTRLETPALASTLTLLEARGLVAAYGGATFHPTVAAKRMGTHAGGRG